MPSANPSIPPRLQPIHFGPPSRRLFGAWHMPGDHAEARPAVLLCNPFGQEAVRAHRMLRVLAERLARAGHAVLRFDYFGSGDSMGDDLDADFDGWRDDVRAADHELRRRSGAGDTVWIGMRLGATVALRAASSVHLRRLVLWDPVLDGPRYLQHLRQRHAETLARAFNLPPAPSPREAAPGSGRSVEEAIGFALSPRFCDQLLQLRAEQPLWPAQPVAIVAVCETRGDASSDLAAALAGDRSRVQVVPLDHGVDWTTDEAGDGALVPAAAVQQLVRLAGEAG